MSEALVEPGALVAPPVPVVSPRDLLPYALLVGVLLMLLIYFIGAEQGAMSLIGGAAVHEWAHDARHLLGFPCH